MLIPLGLAIALARWLRLFDEDSSIGEDDFPQ